MNLNRTPAEKTFRDEFRAWLRSNVPAPWRGAVNSEDRADYIAYLHKWQRALYDGGWAGISWPKKFGGRGATLMEQAIFQEELALADAPQLIGTIGLSLVGPTLIALGTDEQKARYLPPILSGDEIWCQGFSEPNAGSDLAGLQTEARLDGDSYVVNGQKVWTSYADEADWIFGLVRTSSESKHGGISFLLFDMESPGVSTKPILLISGNSPFCETFFDDVKVPKDQLVGEENKGWDVAKYLLGHEREMISGMGLGGGGSLGAAIKPTDPLLRAEIAAFDVDSLAFAAMSERFAAMWKAGEAHPASPSMMKYAGTELNKRRHELLMAAGGSDALEWESTRSRGGKLPRDWLRTKANSIEGGTSEIQLGIVAKHILRLPGA